MNQSLLVPFALLLLLSGCHTDQRSNEKAIDVKIYTVSPQTIPIDLEFIGSVESSHKVEIRSRVEGYLNKIAYKEGAFVNEGDLLFEIDDRVFVDGVKQAQANLEKEQAALWLAQKAVDRYKPLFEQKAASRKDLDDATAQLLSEQALVNLYQARLNEAKINLEYTKISSPISGYTSNARYQEGTLISPNANGTLTTVSVIDPVWVVVNVSEYYFLVSTEEVKKNEMIVPENYDFDVSITLSDGSEFPYHGKVSFISPLYDTSTGTLSARAVFPNPDFILKPGQFVKVIAMGAKRPDAIFVPKECVQQGMGGRYVFVVNEDHRAEMRMVDTGDWYKEYWVIKSGLRKGDQVILAGVNKVEDGSLVRIKREK